MPKYEPRVDQKRCIGCGLCPEMMNEVFKMPAANGRAYVHNEDGWKPDGTEQLELTAQNCPVGAISIDPREEQ
ncbi:ferredoxin [Saliphagus sp. GCM10025334]